MPRTRRLWSNILFTIVCLGGCMLGAPAVFADAEQLACIASTQRVRGMTLNGGGGGDTYFYTGVEQENPNGPMGLANIEDPLSPRSLKSHDSIVFAGTPADWIAAPAGRNLVMCHRRVKFALVIKDHFCSGPLSATDVPNGEIEEITFLGGTTWLADDLLASAPSGSVPGELREKIEEDFEAEFGGEDPPNKGQKPDIAAMLAKWTLVPMSQALGVDRSQARCN